MTIGFHVFLFRCHSKISVSPFLLVTAIKWVNTRTLAAGTHLITTATVTIAAIAFAFDPAINAVAANEAVITVTFARFVTFDPFGICNRVRENTS